MLAIIAVVGGACVWLGLALRRRLGWTTAIAWAGLLWTLAVIAAITLIPANGSPGIVPADAHASSCSWDLGGPAPDGFWILPGGQRLLNAVVFIPPGALLVLAAARWRAAWALVPVGFVLLAAYSGAIETTQLVLARLDRACDITDVVDNVAGAAVGVALGVVLAAVLRPWRHRVRRTRARG